MHENYDVIVVGAGPSGIGIGIALKSLKINFTILERNEIGASFTRWPKEMRLITPSFPSNEFGLPDLNAVTRNTSPALTLNTEHPTGKQYAVYLKRVNALYKLPVQIGVEVKSVIPDENGFVVKTQKGDFRCRFLVWAAGEFQYPNIDGFEGAENCIHNSLVKSWSDLDGDSFIVIGGYESGIDAAYHLSELGKRVLVFDGNDSCSCTDADPSMALSPFTRDRLNKALKTGLVNIVKERVSSVEKKDDKYIVKVGKYNHVTKVQPILATGFKGSLTLIKDLFDWKEGKVELDVYDESTKTPGLYVVGPLLERNGTIFCFIYKFQQRFPIIAHNIAQKLGVDASPLERYWKTGSIESLKEKPKKNSCSC
jgi:cation diffusion facilitator CzcD-associated flavoprotein CzcO